MDTYKLKDLGITVGMFGDDTTFLDILNGMVKIDPRLGIDNVEDLVDQLSKSGFDEDAAKDLCMDQFDGEDMDDENPEADWGDQMYCREAGKQVGSMKKTKELVLGKQQYPVDFQSADIDFPESEYKQLEKEVQQLEDRFSNLIIGPDDYEFGKNAKAEINKYKDSLTKHKNEIIKEANKPINEFDKEIKGLTQRLAKIYKHINDQTKILDEKKRAARKDLRLTQIKKMCSEAGLKIDIAQFPYDSKWSNTNVSEKAFKSAVSEKISMLAEQKKAYQDNLTVIAENASKLGLNADLFIQFFDDGHSLSDVLTEMDIEKQAVDEHIKKEIDHENQKRIQQTSSKAYDPETGEIKGEIFNFKLSFSATKEQVKQLTDFLDKHNISAKRVK